MCGRDQINKVLTAAESRIDIQEILDSVPVVGIQMSALFEDGAEPYRRYAKPFQIAELRLHAFNRAALPATGP
jgi:hypothetical protein